MVRADGESVAPLTEITSSLLSWQGLRTGHCVFAHSSYCAIIRAAFEIKEVCMPHIGVPELIIILVIVVIIFGVGRLPEIGAAMGKAIRGFRESSAGEEKSAVAPENKEPEGK